MNPNNRILVGAAAVLACALASAAEDHGKKVYERNCSACHDGWGGYGAPGIGKYEAWRKSFRDGEKAMIATVINGRVSMPPRGGNPSLTDDDIRAAVRWMIEEVDGKESKVLAGN